MVFIFAWSKNDQFFDVVLPTELSPNLRVNQVAKMVSFVNEWHECFFVVRDFVERSCVVLDVSVENSLHGTVILQLYGLQ